MSTREERVLELAREAWRASEPSEAKVEIAARRIERKLRRGRARPARRHTLVLAFLVVFGGALAWAASGGVQRFSEGASPQRAPALERAARGGLGSDSESWARRTRAPAEHQALTHELTQPGQPMPEAERREQAKPKPASPAPAASWRAVDEALDAKDDARAKQALEGLAKSGDPTTRAKARLGLAQLARSKGDCASARRIAGEIGTMEGVDSSVTKRAAALVAECE